MTKMLKPIILILCNLLSVNLLMAAVSQQPQLQMTAVGSGFTVHASLNGEPIYWGSVRSIADVFGYPLRGGTNTFEAIFEPIPKTPIDDVEVAAGVTIKNLNEVLIAEEFEEDSFESGRRVWQLGFNLATNIIKDDVASAKVVPLTAGDSNLLCRVAVDLSKAVGLRQRQDFDAIFEPADAKLAARSIPQWVFDPKVAVDVSRVTNCASLQMTVGPRWVMVYPRISKSRSQQPWLVSVNNAKLGSRFSVRHIIFAQKDKQWGVVDPMGGWYAVNKMSPWGNP